MAKNEKIQGNNFIKFEKITPFIPLFPFYIS